jgi:hypothetical protein
VTPIPHAHAPVPNPATYPFLANTCTYAHPPPARMPLRYPDGPTLGHLTIARPTSDSAAACMPLACKAHCHRRLGRPHHQSPFSSTRPHPLPPAWSSHLNTSHQLSHSRTITARRWLGPQSSIGSAFHTTRSTSSTLPFDGALLRTVGYVDWFECELEIGFNVH